MTFSLLPGDCLEVLADLEDESIDAVVTDPPYGLSAEPDAAEVLRHWLDGDDYQHRGGGFMGKTWDSFVPGPTVWKECLRVLKPGGHLVAFFGTRTVDLGGMAIRLAGFEIRDCLAWHYGSGFPKSLDVSKAIDRRRYDLDEVYTVTGWIREARDAAGIGNREIDEAFGFSGMAGHWTSSKSQPAVPTLDQVPKLLEVLGVEPDDVPEEIRRLLYELNGVAGEPGKNWTKREVVEERTMIQGGGNALQLREGPRREVEANVTAPATDLARQWQGWGTALKPAFEPIILARKPLIGTVAENVTRFGTGALNVDGCRVEGAKGDGVWGTSNASVDPDRKFNASPDGAEYRSEQHPAGRWPANLILDEEAAAMLDEQSGEQRSGVAVRHNGVKGGDIGPPGSKAVGTPDLGYGDTGGASRFFYQAKASRAERNAGLDGLPERKGGIKNDSGRGYSESDPYREILVRNHHPTVKPIDLMRWLVRLVTPPGGTVLDPFTGSGTTGIAAGLEGFEFLGIEREAEYREIAEARLRWWGDQEGETVEILRRAGLAEKARKAAEEAGQPTLFEEAA